MDAITRFKRITSAQPFIVPVPDMWIETYGNDIYIFSTANRPEYSIIEYAQKEKGGKWIFGLWQNTINGAVVYQENPHQNERGLWVWKLVKS